jgi:thermitase
LVTWIEQIHVAKVRIPTQMGTVAAPLSLPDLLTSPANSFITFAEVDLAVRGAYTPTDPDFSDEMMSYGLEHVQALDAWDIVKGSQQIVIAVVDSGVRFDHPEFGGRLLPGYDFVNDDGQPRDDSGHGTHVAGVVAAALDNGQGVAGVCPNCLILPVKVLNENNLGTWSQLAQGIIFAVDNGARIINLSLGSDIPSETLASAVDYAVESGAVVIAAAGNYGSDDLFYPAALDGVIAVGATNSKGERWAKSDFGSYIDLSAPGELIYSTYYKLNNIYRGYTYMSGTSMASPFVSGVAGLLLSVEPKLSAQQVADALIFGAEDLGPEGWDGEFGHGRVNAMGSLLSPALAEAIGEIIRSDQEVRIYLPVLNAQ